MENIFRYYEFSDFIKDKSATFSENEICFSVLNEQHFLIFEKNKDTYNLYVSKYKSEKEIGVKAPEILEMLIKDYDKSIPDHRIVLRKYLY
ncbi:hypothetical protein Q4553_10940 [Tenacibaculum soleae]|uniref:hypothetical protein n=1 Tax=Tenacibaculum soleae TaxID=447689 RepID=UPI0026E3D6BC|nr:hypothetical protein [Tenacibaculum soleae]MDO6745092.1 hypothetical protein [Tenacibaculum soleae]